MKRKEIGKKLLQLSGGIIGSVFDLCLYQTFLVFTLAGKQHHISTGFYQADQLLEEINHKTIANSLYTLVKKGLIKPLKRGSLQYTITELGKQRIAETFPTYKTHRPWDGYLYLISYDIPKKSNTKRNQLRDYLKKIGCGLLQDSLWMTPYNPQGIVEDFVEEHNIPGTILVSKLGKDGSIGDEDRQSLINRIYQYDKLADRYTEFIEAYANNHRRTPFDISMAYLTILKDDPQLPFPLEPPNFPAKKAYDLTRHSQTI